MPIESTSARLETGGGRRYVRFQKATSIAPSLDPQKRKLPKSTEGKSSRSYGQIRPTYEIARPDQEEKKGSLVRPSWQASKRETNLPQLAKGARRGKRRRTRFLSKKLETNSNKERTGPRKCGESSKTEKQLRRRRNP